MRTREKSNVDFIKEIKELVGDEYTFLEEYKGTRIKILIRHNTCKNEYLVCPNKFISAGRRCPLCANKSRAEKNSLTQEQFLKEVIEQVGDEYTFLEEYKGTDTKISIRHNKERCGNYEYQVTPNMFLRKKIRCPICADKHNRSSIIYDFTHNPEHSNINILDLTEGLKVLSLECKLCSHKFDRTVQWSRTSNIICPACSMKPQSLSKGEMRIKKFLDKNEILYEMHVRDIECKNVLPLEFDFKVYMNDNTFIYIEFDGKQHFKSSKFYGGDENLDIVQKRDKIKTEYCETNNIPLLRISHSDINYTQQNLKQFLNL